MIMLSTPVINEQMTITVVYALPNDQHVITLSVHDRCTAQQAVEISGLLQQFPNIQLSKVTLGVFGKPVSDNTILHDGDRLEIYRTLMLDPKESRRKRAQLARNKN